LRRWRAGAAFFGGTARSLQTVPQSDRQAWHDGSLNDWRQVFEGKDVVEISPTFYKISVPTTTPSCVG
jgi:hypothetical protein